MNKVLNRCVLNNITKNFYIHANKHFNDKIIVNPPTGFMKIIDIFGKHHLKNKTQLNILDIGCGDLRFLKALKQKNNLFKYKYCGVDSNRYYVKKANNKSIDVKYFNIVEKIAHFEGTYDLIVALGITHHIPGYEYRKYWFSELSNHLSMKGIIAFSIWDFLKSKKLQDKIIDHKKIAKVNKYYQQSINLQQNDYFISRNDMKGVFRYCHYYNSDEIDDLKRVLTLNNVELIKQFNTRKSYDSLNTYFMFIKN